MTVSWGATLSAIYIRMVHSITGSVYWGGVKLKDVANARVCEEESMYSLKKSAQVILSMPRESQI